MELRNKLLIIVLMLLDVVASSETEINIPSFPDMIKHFNTTPQMMQLVVGINFLGVCISSLIYGAFSEKYGRRTPLLIGQIVFFIGSLGCILSFDNIYMLLLFRFIQGFGASSVFVISSAIIFDIYNKQEAAKIYGYMNSIITLFMAGSPILGSIINELLGWEYNFYVILGASAISLVTVWKYVYETLPPEKRTPVTIQDTFSAYKSIVTSKITIGLLIIVATTVSSYFVYVTYLSIIFIDYLKVPEIEYGYYQAATTMAFAFASFSTSYFIKKIGYITTRNLSSVFTAISSLGFLIFAFITPENPLVITIFMSLISIGLAYFVTIIFGDYMEQAPNNKGITASFCTFFRLLSTFCFLSIAALFFDGTIIPIAVSVFTLNIVACLIYLLINKKIKLS